jgi:hypothetical protein
MEVPTLDFARDDIVEQFVALAGTGSSPEHWAREKLDSTCKAICAQPAVFTIIDNLVSTDRYVLKLKDFVQNYYTLFFEHDLEKTAFQLKELDEIFLNSFILESLLEQGRLADALFIYTEINGRLNVHDGAALRRSFVLEALRRNELESIAACCYSLTAGNKRTFEFHFSQEDEIESLNNIMIGSIDLDYLDRASEKDWVMLGLLWCKHYLSSMFDGGIELDFAELLSSYPAYRRLRRLSAIDIGEFAGMYNFIFAKSLKAALINLTDEEILAGLARLQIITGKAQPTLKELLLLPYLADKSNYFDLQTAINAAYLSLDAPSDAPDIMHAVVHNWTTSKQTNIATSPELNLRLADNKAHKQVYKGLNSQTEPLKYLQALKNLAASGIRVPSEVILAATLSEFEPFKGFWQTGHATFEEVQDLVNVHLKNLEISDLQFRAAELERLLSEKVFTRIDILKHFSSSDIRLIFDFLEAERWNPTVCEVLRRLVSSSPRHTVTLLESYQQLKIEGSLLAPDITNPRYLMTGQGKTKEKIDEFRLAVRELGAPTPNLYKLWLATVASGDRIQRQNFIGSLRKLRISLIHDNDSLEAVTLFFAEAGIRADPQELLVEMIGSTMKLGSSDLKNMPAQLVELAQGDIDRNKKYFSNLLDITASTTFMDEKIVDVDYQSLQELALSRASWSNPKSPQSETNLLMETINSLFPQHMEINVRFLNKLRATFNWVSAQGELRIEAFDWLNKENLAVDGFSSDNSRAILANFAKWRAQTLAAISSIVVPQQPINTYMRVGSSLLSFYAKAAVRICTANNAELYNHSFHLDMFAEGENGDTTIIGTNQLFVFEAIDESGAKTKVLFIRGINQIDEYGSPENSAVYVQKVMRFCLTLASTNGFDALLLCPHDGWHADSNRETNIEYLNRYCRPSNCVTFDAEVDIADGRCSINHAYLIGQTPEKNIRSLNTITNPLIIDEL